MQIKSNEHNQPELGLGIVTDSDNKVTDKEVDRAHRQFMLLFKHILTPSTQGLFDYEINPKSIKSKSKYYKFSVKHHKEYQQMKEQNDMEEENFTILKTEDVIYELSSMLNQGLQYLKSDMSKLIKSELLHKNKKQIMSETEDYNMKFYLNNHSEEDTFQSESNLPKFDEFLLQSFYILFIGPFLNKRDYKYLQIESQDLLFIGKDELVKRMEVIELNIECHKLFVGTECHPEYLSKVLDPSRPILGLIDAFAVY
ncbi:hypothetical protein KGF54_005176 [Candida jiufengensis]|uniref:uncharacterized protein n=1 Tax=Candida jiufengensis TaxID=497108 RepID=UPI002224C4B0|nr:uncharacterized protein KGF54_005176 [Candida jiufengensis]KAI5950359.1 hypothetical protein KGF54_005176 [Candida jiufengensis]